MNSDTRILAQCLYHWIPVAEWLKKSNCATGDRRKHRYAKNEYFTVRLTVKGGGAAPLGPDRRQM